MADSLALENQKFLSRFRKRLAQGGEQEIGNGLYYLGRLDDRPADLGSPVEAAPIQKRRPKNTSEREELVGQLADRLMEYYLAHYNDPTVLVNPFRDGLPNCTKHRFPPGCWYGCREGVLPTVRHATRGQIQDWIRRWVASRAEVLNAKRGWKADLSGQIRVHRDTIA